jgi:hypothetical protein
MERTMWKTIAAFYKELYEDSRDASVEARSWVDSANKRLQTLANEDHGDREQVMAENALNTRQRSIAAIEGHMVHMAEWSEKVKRFSRFRWPDEIVSPKVERSSTYGFVVVHLFRVDTVDGEHAGTFELCIPYTKIRWGCEEAANLSLGDKGFFRWKEKHHRLLTLDSFLVKELAFNCNPMGAIQNHQVPLKDIFDKMSGMVGRYCSIAGHQNVFGGAGMNAKRTRLVFVTGTTRDNYYTFTLEDPVYVLRNWLLRPVQHSVGDWSLDYLMGLGGGRCSDTWWNRQKYWHRMSRYECEREAHPHDLTINTWGEA